MKYIFDFDNVLLHTNKIRREHMYPTFQNVGVSIKDIDDYYQETRKLHFSVKELIKNFSLKEEVYEEVMRRTAEFSNTELIEIIKKLGKENCFIVTFGDEEFQLDKIKRVNISDLFSEIIVVPEGKKSAIEDICARYLNEEILFLDDKKEHFEDLDFQKYPNLKTILYDENGLEKFKAEIVKI